MFSLRIVTVDSYQSIPNKGYDCFYSEFRSCETYKVPIIRIFGVTPAGQKACLHVHGVFPYLLLRWKDVFPGIDIKDSHRYLQELALEIDKSLHVAARSSNSSRHHVFKISETKGFCFYGYHEDEEDFLRIYFYNPYDINRTTELLANGTILNKFIQPHQAHFPFILQFLSDFNLSGMNLVNVSQFKFRASSSTTSEPSIVTNLPLSSLLDDSSHSGDILWNASALCSSQINNIPRQTHCELELDCCSSDIMNKIDRTMCVGENPGIAAIWAEERMRRKAENDTTPLTPIPSQDRLNAFETPSDIYYKDVVHKMLECQELKFTLQSSGAADEDLFLASQSTLFQSSSESLSLSNTQDKELLRDFLSMANGNDPENDSILAHAIDSDSEEETILMSQRFVAESWTPQEPGINVSSSSVFEQRMEVYSTTINTKDIPQLDGAHDDEDYELYVPTLLKEEKESSNSKQTNGLVLFDEEPPVLQPEPPLTAGATSCSLLRIERTLELERSCMKKCSVKMEKHPILKNIDPTKPILLTTLEKSVSKSVFTSKKSSKIAWKHQPFKESQASQATNAIQPTSHVQNEKNSKKSQKVLLSVTKCVASILSKVEVMVDGSGRSHMLKTFNTELKFSKTQINTVITSSSSSKYRDSDLQCATKPKFEDNSGSSKIKKSVLSESMKKSSSKNKISRSHTQHKPQRGKLELTCDNIELNTNDFVPSSVKTSKLKSNSLTQPNSNKSLATNSSNSNSSSAKLSTKSRFTYEEINSLALNSISTGLRDISKPSMNKDKLLKPKLVKKDKSSSKRVHSDLASITAVNNDGSNTNANPKKLKLAVNEQNPPKLSGFSNLLVPNNFTHNTLRWGCNVETVNLSKLGNEVVILQRLSEEEIAYYLKPPSLKNTIEQTSIASCRSKISMSETLSKNLSKSRCSQKANNVSQRTKQTDMSLGPKYLIDKLSSEEKTSIVSNSTSSKSTSTHRFTFPKTCFESKSPTTKQKVNNKQSLFPSFNNDDSDFKTSFSKYESPTKFSSKEQVLPSTSVLPKSNKSSVSGGKNAQNNHHQLHNMKDSITKRKTKSSKTVCSKSFGLLEVSNTACKSEVKNVIEEQVKNSLDESLSDEIPEISVISVKSSLELASQKIIEIDLCSDEEEEISPAQPETFNDEEDVAKNDKFGCAAYVHLVDCCHLLKKHPDDTSATVLDEIENATKYTCPACKTKLSKSSEVESVPSKSVNNNSLNHKITSENEQINKIPEKSSNCSEPTETSNSSLLYAIKTEPLEHKESSKIKEKPNSSNTADESLLSKPILPFAVKSKPIVKAKSNINDTLNGICNLNNSTEKNDKIYAVKSVPTVKTTAYKQTNLSNDVKLKNKSSDANALLSSNSCPNSKLPSDKTTNHFLKASASHKTATPSPIKTTKIDENKIKPSFKSSEVIKCNNKTEKSFPGLKELDSIPTNVTAESLTVLPCDSKNGTGAHKSTRKHRKNKSGTSQKNKDTSTNSFVSDSACCENSTSTLSNIVTNPKVKFINCDSKLEDVLPKATNSQYCIQKNDKSNLNLPEKSISNIIKETSKIFYEKSKSLDLPSSTNILARDGKFVNQEVSSEEVLSHLKINGSKMSAIHSSYTDIAVHINLTPNDMEVNKSTDNLESDNLKTTTNDAPDNVHVIENDLYDIVKRRNSNKTNLNSKSNTKAGADKLSSNNCVDKVLPTPKTSRSTRKSISNSKSDTLSSSSKKTNNVPTNSEPVATKEAIVKPNCNVLTEDELPSVEKPIICSTDKALLNSGEEDISNRTRNKSACKDSAQTNDGNTESAAISPPTIDSQTLENMPSKNPISLVSRGRKGKNGKESNNFGFFCSKNSKRRRNSPETPVIPKPLSKKLSLKTKSTRTAKVKNSSPLQPTNKRKWKIDNDLLKNAPQKEASVNHSGECLLPETIIIKQEPLEEDDVTAQSSDMKDALSRFDFDESASIEPTSCSYSSKRSRKNCQTKSDSKTSAAKLVSPEAKSIKSSQKQKKHSSSSRKGTKRSSRFNSSTTEKVVSDLEEANASNQDDNPNFKLIQMSPKIKLKRDSFGQISVVPSNTSKSLSESSVSKSEFHSDFQSPSTSHCLRQGKDNKTGLEEKHSLKMKIFMDSSTRNRETKELQCIILSGDSDCEAEKTVKIPRKRGRLSRRKSEPFTNPCEPLVPPILIKNIKKEKIDDYEQQPYVVPLKVNLSTQSIAECNKSQTSEPKCEPIKLYRNADQFYINPAISNPENETKLKRSRGRPRKVSKDVSPVKNGTSFSDEKVPILRIPKRSATESSGIPEINSNRPLGRKTRSNSARASTSLHWSEVKIKQEPISDEEYVAPSNATPELPTSLIKSRRRSSLKCDNFKKFFDSDSGDSDDSEPKIIKACSPKKKKMNGETMDISDTNSSKKVCSRRASATNNFSQFFESDKNEDSDDCKVVFSTLPKKANLSTKQRRSSSSNKRRRRRSSSKKGCSSENSIILPDTANSNLYACVVNVHRLLQSEIEKHSLEPHAVNMNKEESKTVTLASASSDASGLLKSVTEKPEMPSLDMETRSNKMINRKSTEEKHKHNSLSLKRTRSQERESILTVTPPENALVKLIPDTPFVSLRKLTSASLENSTETLHENAMKECNYIPVTVPPTNINTIAQPENLQRELSSEIVSQTNVSTPEMVMKENVIESEKEPLVVQSSSVGRRKDLSPGSKIFAQGRGNFPHEWDSPQDMTVAKDIINGSLADSSPLEADHANHSNESPEFCQVNCINIETSKQDSIKITCSMDTSHTTKVAESPVPQKTRNIKGNLFDKVSEEMIKHQEGIFDGTQLKKCLSGDNLISLEQQNSFSFNASQEIDKFDIPFGKATQDIQQPFKSLSGGFKRRQDNQTVSCFKGYDLLSDTGIMPPASSQKLSRNMFEIPTEEIMDYSCDTLCSPIVSKKSQPSYIQQSNNKHNSIDPNKTQSMHNLNYPGMQLDNNSHYFPNLNNSYYEANRLQPSFSMQQNKYAKSNMHENRNTNNTFNGAGWPNVGSSFCSNDGLTHGQSSNNPLQVQKSEDLFKNNAHQLSNSEYFPKHQFDNTDISHLQNYFSPEETRRLWSPIEQAKSDSSFGKSTEMFLNEYASSSNDHYSTGMPSPVPSLPHLTFQNTPVSNSLQNNRLTGHLPTFQSSKEKNNSVESFDTNSLSPMPSSPKVLRVVNNSDDIMSPYHASKKSPDKLSNDDDTEKAMKSLSDVLAGSPLDVENDSVSINCDAFPASVEDIKPDTSQNFCKSETLTSTGMKIKPVNKYDDSELSQLNLGNSFPTLDFTCLTENDIDHNLLDFEEIACNNSTVQTNAPGVSSSSTKISKSTYEVPSEAKPKNNAANDIEEKKLLPTETLPNTSTNNSTDSATSTSYKVPFQNNNIPLVSQPNEECFPQLSIPTYNPVNQTFLPTLMVGESVMVPQSNFFLNDSSIVINRDSSSQDLVDILPKSPPVTDNSISVISDSEPSSNQEVDNFKQSFNQGEDILSMIVKSCDIGEEFDENLGSPAEGMNESLPNGINDSVALDSMIHSFYGDDTLYGLNQTNTETFCSDLQNLNGTCEATTISAPKESLEEPHIDNAISSSHLSVLPLRNISTSELKLVNQAGIEGNSCDLSVNEAKRTVVPLPKTQSHSIFNHKNNASNSTLVLHQKPKKRKRIHEVDSNSCQTFNENSRDSNYDKTCDNQETSYHMSSDLNANSQHKEKVQVSFNTNHTNSNFLSGDNLESTPSASRQESRHFLSEELGVSPINKDILLTSGTKKKRRLLFDRKTVPLDKNFKKPVKDVTAGAYKRFWENSLLTNHSLESEKNLSKSDIDGPTLENSRGFKVNVDDLGDARVRHEVQHLNIMSLEVHVNTRNELRPDPRFDSVAAIFYSIYNDVGFLKQENFGMIVVDNSSLKTDSFCGTHASLKNFLSLVPCVEKNEVFIVKEENELFQQLISIVRQWDPDILVGYEIQMASWGYLIERAGVLNLNLTSKLSRLLYTNESRLQQVEQDPTVTDQTADLDRLNIPGRIVLNLWRLLRKEVTLNVYTFENVYFHLLHKRTPLYPFHDLTSWFTSRKGREAVIRYYATRVVGSVQFLEKFDLIRRTSEMARLFGIQFYEVLSRGSQFRVESMMLRIVTPMRYIPVTPSIQQRSKMRAPECVPLILEPQSKYYTNPVLVLDFQSLYPSMIMAYNYCFSTCLGRVDNLCKDGASNFGCTSLNISYDVLQRLARDDNIHYSPLGVAFIKPLVRRGILPIMLEEILGTRVLVKLSMKKIRDNPALKKLLDARQMALKLIANVTYGYTAANFSGRMPCVEVADSIVSKGRETLERAIQLVEGNSRWNANVIYGDTDSFFVELPGRSKEDAFKIGQEIVDAVTATNPKPVKLKLEKVYSRCVLESKKRYVGFMYETIDQVKPVFDAKGIETVRRDSCSATAKILEKSLKILFRTDAINLVQQYVQKQFRRLLAGRVNMTDLIFAKEYRGKAGYRPTACVPALEIAKKRLVKDPRSEPRVGERVPYVVVYGFPDTPIIKLVHEPAELLNDINLRINTTYYITRVISPPLDRVFSLMNVDVKTWYNSIAHTVKLNLPMLHDPNHHRETITQYFASRNCPSCDETTLTSICETCRQDPQGTVVTLQEKIRKWERSESNLKKICTSCSKSSTKVDHCASIDCPILFKLNLAKRDTSQIPYLKKVLAQDLF